ncbi:hypothetical protein KW786_01580 [Candidatus Parcubacteria bacterium]|nr:hypothetical protein [Candidatus Parcubacteria bacterium]
MTTTTMNLVAVASAHRVNLSLLKLSREEVPEILWDTEPPKKQPPANGPTDLVEVKLEPERQFDRQHHCCVVGIRSALESAGLVLVEVYLNRRGEGKSTVELRFARAGTRTVSEFVTKNGPAVAKALDSLFEALPFNLDGWDNPYWEKRGNEEKRIYCGKREVRFNLAACREGKNDEVMLKVEDGHLAYVPFPS